MKEQEREKLLEWAKQCDARKDYITAGIYRVMAGNDYTNWKRRHMPNLGPYTPLNVKRCEHCGKPSDQWNINEECQ
jgi:hypothetical protein